MEAIGPAVLTAATASVWRAPMIRQRLCRLITEWGGLRAGGVIARIVGRGVEFSQRLGRYHWVVERAVSWLNGCRRLHRRHEREAEHFLAFIGIAAALICYRRLTE